MTQDKPRFETLDRCPVCRSGRIVSFRRGNFDIRTVSENDLKITDREYGKIWDLSRCLDCRHVFANPRPNPEFIQALYGKIEDPDYQDEAEGRGRNFFRILDRLGKLHPDRGALLDVGAATGILLELARKRGWDPAGVEPSGWAVAAAERRYGLDLVQGGFEEAPLPEGRFTALTMVDFIEHIPRPGPAVRKAHRLLAPGGTLCLVTPDVGSLAARAAGKRWWHFRPAHLAYFTRRSLITLLEDSGFRILRVNRYAWTFSAYYLISRLPPLEFLIKSRRMASFWKRIPIKLALGDSFEIYARKDGKS
jgi:SAM-dependent methyltransferase